MGCLGAAWPAHLRGFDAAIPARTLAKAINMQNVEDNKKVVLTFYNKALNDKDPQAALQYLGAPYVQHNPDAEDGSAGFVKYINFIRQSFPQSHSEIKAAFAEGDFVIAPFDEAAAARFDNLYQAKIRIGTSDLKIAAVALVCDALLLTANRQDFEKVPGLRFENWLD